MKPNNIQRTALVTGAAKRLGRAIACGLAADGWDIVVHYHSSEIEALATVDAIKAIGREAVALACDLSNETSTRKLIEQSVQALGRISCVVNSASLFEYDDAETFSIATLNAHMHTNLAAPILLAQALYETTPDGEQSVGPQLLGGHVQAVGEAAVHDMDPRAVGREHVEPFVVGCGVADAQHSGAGAGGRRVANDPAARLGSAE